MKKWFLISIIYSLPDCFTDTLVEYISEDNINSILTNLFWMDDSPGLEIFELTPEGEKKERLDLVQKILSSHEENAEKF